jgi:hypothetical protein
MQPLALLVNPKVPVNTLQGVHGLHAQAPRPDQLRLGRQRRHQPPGARDVQDATGLFMVHIPYRGSAPAFTDLMAGQVQFMAESIPQAASYHKQGKVRALAVTSRERNPALPDTPTVIEAGIKGFEVVGFYGFLAPAGTPRDVVAKLSDAFKAGADHPRSAAAWWRRAPTRRFWDAEDFAQVPRCRNAQVGAGGQGLRRQAGLTCGLRHCWRLSAAQLVSRLPHGRTSAPVQALQACLDRMARRQPRHQRVRACGPRRRPASCPGTASAQRWAARPSRSARWTACR